MSHHAFFIAMSYGMLAICVVAEIMLLRAGRRAALARARAVRQSEESS
jgi:heme exporter protein CcmD